VAIFAERAAAKRSFFLLLSALSELPRVWRVAVVEEIWESGERFAETPVLSLAVRGIDILLARPRLRPARCKDSKTAWEQHRLGEAASLTADRNL
jgi:hypothetical protein